MTLLAYQNTQETMTVFLLEMRYLLAMDERHALEIQYELPHVYPPPHVRCRHLAMGVKEFQDLDLCGGEPLRCRLRPYHP